MRIDLGETCLQLAGSETIVATESISRHGPQGEEHDARLVAIVALPSFTLLALGSILDALRLANRVSGRAIYRWQLVGLDSAITASSHVNLIADATVAEMQGRHADIVIVCGGIDGHLHKDRRLHAWLRMLDHHGAIIGAVSTGIWPLARAGLLDGRRCAVHWDDRVSFSASFPLVAVQHDIFVQDGRRLTCSGGVAIVDMVLHLIAMQHSQGFADDVADLLIHARIRTADEKQRKSERVETAALGVVRRVIRLMEAHVETVLPIVDIAEQTGRSPRQLERLFAQAFETTPKRYYDLIRLRRAQKLLTETELSVTEIAIRCGYASQPQFSVQFRKAFAKSPRQCRQTARA